MNDYAEQIDRSQRGRGLATHEVNWLNPSNDELVEFVEAQYAAGKDRRRAWEARAAQNLAYAAGEQECHWDATTLDLVNDTLRANTSSAWWQPIEVNLIKGFVLHRIALCAGQPVTWQVHPFSADDADIAGARIGNKLLQHQCAGGDAGYQQRLIEAYWQMFCTGVVFAAVLWDPTRGKRDTFRSDRGEKGREGFIGRIARRLGRKPDDVELDGDGGYTAWAGDVHVEFPTGFEITEPHRCRCVEDAEWLIWSRIISKSALFERYGAVAKSVPADSTSDAFTNGLVAEYGDFGKVSPKGAGEHEAPADHVLVHDLWRRASVRYPQGYRGVVAGETVMLKGPNPYDPGGLPFVGFKELPQRRFRPGSTVGMLIKLQDGRNRLKSEILTSVNKAVEPHWITSKGAQLPADFLQVGPAVTEVEDGYEDRVKPLPMPTIPQSAFEMDHGLHEDMQEVAGIHDSTSGRGESAQQSGRHAALLQASDARGASVTRLLLEHSLAQVGRLSLWRYRQYVQSNRLVVLTGGDYAYEALQFKGTDLGGGNGTPDTWNLDVSIGVEPDLPGLVESVELLIRAGVLNPAEREEDRLTVQRLLGQRATRDFDESALHRANAARENEDLANGKEVAAALGDAHLHHLREHKRFTIGKRYREAVAKNSRVATLLILHVREHEYQAADEELRPKFQAQKVTQELADLYGGDGGTASAGPSAQPTMGPRPGPGFPAPPVPGAQPENMSFAM